MTDTMKIGISMALCSPNEDERIQAYRLYFNLFDKNDLSENNWSFYRDIAKSIRTETPRVTNALIDLKILIERK